MEIQAQMQSYVNQTELTSELNLQLLNSCWTALSSKNDWLVENCWHELISD